jgi:hypothetical protein
MPVAGNFRLETLNLELEAYFSPDYPSARERFRAAARAAGASLDALALDARGPRGETLSIDIARLGDPGARRVLLHTSGLHGVEAYAGSAIQLAALAAPPAPPPGCAVVLVHVLNPYGMAWLRRANENNVDLNRNFIAPGEPREGAAPLYARLDPLLNPASPPGADGFLLRLAAVAARHGLRAVKQAIAEGQYEFPRGLFYGGAALEPGPRLYLQWLQRHVPPSAYLLALDAHTGLGPWGRDTLLLEPGVAATPAQQLARALGRALVDPSAGGAAYRIRGGMGNALPGALPGARVDFVLQEIGTRRALSVLRALREENRCHHYGTNRIDHPARRALREALCPAAPAWRRRAVEHGLALLRAAAAWTWKTESGER